MNNFWAVILGNRKLSDKTWFYKVIQCNPEGEFLINGIKSSKVRNIYEIGYLSLTHLNENYSPIPNGSIVNCFEYEAEEYYINVENEFKGYIK